MQSTRIWRTVPLGICILAMLASVYAAPAAAAGARHSHAAKTTIPQRCKKYLKAKGTIKFSDWRFRIR